MPPRPPARSAADPLKAYRAKRDFRRTPEPAGDAPAAAAVPETPLCFVVQKHAATRLHYDFRLELDGVMLSWALPKGPSFDPADKRMAVQVEDHPISYNTFEGEIPKGQYGAGRVIVWDRGVWLPETDPHAGLAEGKLVFTLQGHKLFGRWELVRIKPPGVERQTPWILFKKPDAHARRRAEYDVVSALPDSVNTLPPAAPPEADVPKDLPQLPAQATGALRAELPARLSPQLATAAAGLPPTGDWVLEIKFDGYRLLARIERGQVRLFTRAGHDWTSRLPALAASLGRLPIESGWLDGEIVVLNERGVPDFQALQTAFDARGGNAIVYFLFDLPFLDGWDLRAAPLRERRALLQQRLQPAATHGDDRRLRFSEAFEADLASLLHSARRLQLEGLMAKRADAPYRSARSDSWLKLKLRLRQEFVVGGFTDRGGERGAAEVGSLLLGVFDERGRLLPVGGVGTGWDARTAAALKRRLLALEQPAPAFAADVPRPADAAGRWSRRQAGAERWVRPELVVEVSFAAWTDDEQIRHATFEGLRADKPAATVRRDPAPLARGGSGQPLQLKVTHPERVIDPGTGLTKLDLVRYYESMAERMLPHLAGRPCSLVRGPDGVEGALFYQKHAEQLRAPGLVSLDPALWPDHEPLIAVEAATALAHLAQLNVIELHTWNASVRRIERPDRLVFDLDPGSGVPWPRVIEAAQLLHGLLQELGLAAWLKTSGGKGLHVVVPLTPREGWEAVYAFSEAVVQHLARVIPDRFVARSGPANRVGRIYVDYLRNHRGATTVVAYSARARPGLGVSMPLRWDDLPRLKSADQWTIANAREHLSFDPRDPWADYWQARQTLTQARRRLTGG